MWNNSKKTKYIIGIIILITMLNSCKESNDKYFIGENGQNNLGFNYDSGYGNIKTGEYVERRDSLYSEEIQDIIREEQQKVVFRDMSELYRDMREMYRRMNEGD